MRWRVCLFGRSSLAVTNRPASSGNTLLKCTFLHSVECIVRFRRTHTHTVAHRITKRVMQRLVHSSWVTNGAAPVAVLHSSFVHDKSGRPGGVHAFLPSPFVAYCCCCCCYCTGTINHLFPLPHVPDGSGNASFRGKLSSPPCWLLCGVAAVDCFFLLLSLSFTTKNAQHSEGMERG